VDGPRQDSNRIREALYGERRVVLRYQHSIEWRSVVLAVGGLLGGVLLLLFLRAIVGPLVFIAITISIAEALRPPVEFLHRRGIGRGPAVLLVYGVIAATAFCALSFLLSPFVAQINGLFRDLPSYVAQLQKPSYVAQLQKPSYVAQLQEEINRLRSLGYSYKEAWGKKG